MSEKNYNATENDAKIKEMTGYTWLEFYNKFWDDKAEIYNKAGYRNDNLKDEAYKKILELIDNCKTEKNIIKNMEKMFEVVDLIYSPNVNSDDIFMPVDPAYDFFNNEKLKEIFKKAKDAGIKFNDRTLYLIFNNSVWDASDENIVKELFDGYESTIKNPGFFLSNLICNSINLDNNAIKDLYAVLKINFFGFLKFILEKFKGKLNSDTMEILFCKKNEKPICNLGDDLICLLLDKLDNDCKFNLDVLNNLFTYLPKNCLNKNRLISIFTKIDNGIDIENVDLNKYYDACNEEIFNEENETEIFKYLQGNQKKLFEKLCNVNLVGRKEQNKKLGILGSGGVTVGGLFGLIAIGLGVAVGIGALTVTIAAPIALAVVSSVLMGIFGYVTDKFRVNKELNKIEEAKLTKKEYDKKEIPFDLRKRKKIKDALDVSNDLLYQKEDSEIVQ